MKVIPIFGITLLTASFLIFWFQFYIQGNYYQHAGFLTASLGAIAPAVVVYLAIRLIKFIITGK